MEIHEKVSETSGHREWAERVREYLIIDATSRMDVWWTTTEGEVELVELLRLYSERDIERGGVEIYEITGRRNPLEFLRKEG